MALKRECLNRMSELLSAGKVKCSGVLSLQLPPKGRQRAASNKPPMMHVQHAEVE